MEAPTPHGDHFTKSCEHGAAATKHPVSSRSKARHVLSVAAVWADASQIGHARLMLCGATVRNSGLAVGEPESCNPTGFVQGCVRTTCLAGDPPAARELLRDDALARELAA